MFSGVNGRSAFQIMGAMEPYHPKVILCPTDFSQTAGLALRYAKQLADCFAAQLFVLYADLFEPPIYFTRSKVDEIARTLEYSKEAAYAYLVRHVKEQIGESGEFKALVIEGQTVSTIDRISREKKADLIVMGSHGRSGLNRFVLGSVTEKILHYTGHPLLIVHEKKAEREPGKIFIRQVLCPVNYSEFAHMALNQAAAISRCFGAELVVLHVVETQSRDIGAEEEHDRLCAWVPPESRIGCTLRESVRRGDAAEQIIDAANSAGCDIIVLGVKHKRFHDTTVIGTTSLRVTRHSPCPVLAIFDGYSSKSHFE